jgi:hypothetical protein
LTTNLEAVALVGIAAQMEDNPLLGIEARLFIYLN